MSRVILAIDGGGIRGAAATQFLTRVEQRLQREHDTSLRHCVDYYAGTSTGAIIALALATTTMPIDKINRLYNPRSGRAIFSPNRGWFEIDGINAPRYAGSGKTRFLKRWFGQASLAGAGQTGRHVLCVSYSVEQNRPVVIKSHHPDHHELTSFAVADASSAAPTYFPSRPLPSLPGKRQQWLIDGGVVANNPTLCAIAESQRLWPQIPMSDVRVLSIGTGKRTRKINGPATQDWGALQWMRQGDLIDVLSDEQLIAYQAKAILAEGHYIRVNSAMEKQPGLSHPPDDAMDDVSPDNLTLLKAMGDFWYQHYGDQVVAFLLGDYQGPSLDAIPAPGG